MYYRVLLIRLVHLVGHHPPDECIETVEVRVKWVREPSLDPIILVLMSFYIFYRKKKEEARQREYQDQLYAYTTEIDQLTISKDGALAQIRELETNKDKNLQKISHLEEEAKEAEKAIKKLNQSIKKLLNEEAPKLKEGKMLYDQIMEADHRDGSTDHFSAKALVK